MGSAACAFAGWALWDGRASEGPAGRAALCALGAWGAALATGALLALCGAARASASLLAAAFALLALAAVAEGAAVWWGAAHLPQLRRALRERLDVTLRQDYGVVPARTHMLDAIQHGLECCGAESVRDWQNSAWSRLQEERAEPEAAARAAGALDLSVGAPSAYYWVPASCCEAAAEGECAGEGAGAGAQRVPAASGRARGVHAAACGPRVLAALERGSRAPLAGCGLLAAAHAVSLMLTLALCLRANPPPAYKA